MKRASVFLLLFSILSSATLNLVMAESTVNFNSSSITVNIINPENITYNSSSIQVIVSAHADPGVADVAYSLDGGNLTYIAKWYLAHNFNDTFSLNGLEEGTHRLDVQASTLAQNSNGYIIAHSRVIFSITTKTTSTPTLDPIVVQTNSPTPNPTPTSSPVPLEQTPTLTPAQVGSDFNKSDTAIAVTAIVIVMLIVASVSVVYFGRRKGKLASKQTLLLSAHNINGSA
jgi:hypothetical protein